MFVFLSCEKTEIQNTSSLSANNPAIHTRGNCELCPDDEECCCIIYLLAPSTSGSVRLCGTANGGLDCSGNATTNCPSFSGGGIATSFTMLDHSEPFCMAENSPFYVMNTGSSGTLHVVVSCQSDLPNSDTIQLHIPAGQFRYVETNTDCEVSSCE